jgi:hypothetical protein
MSSTMLRELFLCHAEGEAAHSARQVKMLEAALGRMEAGDAAVAAAAKAGGGKAWVSVANGDGGPAL